MHDSFTTLRGRKGAHVLHSKYDSREISQPARDASPGSDAYWELQVDPHGTLDPAERTRRAGHAKKSYFLGLALKSAKARKKGLVISVGEIDRHGRIIRVFHRSSTASWSHAPGERYRYWTDKGPQAGRGKRRYGWVEMRCDCPQIPDKAADKETAAEDVRRSPGATGPALDAAVGGDRG